MGRTQIFRRLNILATSFLALSLTALAFEFTAFPQETAKQPGSTQNPTDLANLVDGGPISRELAGDEVHSYRISLVAGQYIRVIVERKGIDVEVKIFHPDGRKIAGVHGPNGRLGAERLSALAEADGAYRVEVRSVEADAARGRYEIRIDQLRAATEADRSILAGQTAYAEGERAYLQKPSNREEAFRKYEQAVTFFRAGGDRTGEAIALTDMGVVSNLMGRRQEALDYLNQALHLHQAVDNRFEQARTLTYMGFACSGLLERQRALEHFTQALQISKALGDQANAAGALDHMSGIYGVLGDTPKALQCLNEALSLSRATGNRSLEARILANIGATYNSFGDWQTALEYFNEALPLHKALDDINGEALTLTNIGFVYSSLGDWRKALEYFDRALPLHKAVDDRRWTEGMALSSIGLALSGLGKTTEALEYLNQGLAIHRAVRNRNWEARTLLYLGGVHDSLGEREKALGYFAQALELSRVAGNQNTQANALLKIARVERDRDNLVEARHRTEAALELVESLRARIGGQEWRASYLASKRDYYEFYIDLLMRLGLEAEALQANERARGRGLLETLNEARVNIRQGVDPQLLERERTLQRQVNDDELRRIRAINSKSAPKDIEAIEEKLSGLLVDYSRVQAEIRVRSPHYAALTQPVPLTLREIQQQVLDEKTVLLEYALGKEKSYLWVVTRSDLKSFMLPKREVVEASARRVHDLLMVSHRIEARHAADSALIELAQLVLSPAAGLLDKQRVLIVGDGGLDYVPFAALPVLSAQSFADRTPGRSVAYEPLIAAHEVINLPSASVLALLRREIPARPRATQTLAVLADAVFQDDDSRFKQSRGRAHASSTPNTDDQGMPQTDLMRSAAESGLLNFRRLPFSRREAEAIVTEVGRSRSLEALDFAASRKTVFDAKLDQYRIVHFATHGLLNSQHPALSGIVLSLYDERGQPIDGFLRSHETYNLKLNADLVVLSACRTGLGKEIRGEGLVGLTRGFMYAGAASVVASLWDVKDEATSELMTRFYEKMFKDKLKPAAALRAAQVSMWREKRWAAPYYWAGFTLQGEWR
jgi:CHAT domain-containing protein/tetratricopeptide (TPR) repeat protein